MDGGGQKRPSGAWDALVPQMTDRTQDRTVSEWTVAAMFDRLASPDGLTAQASSFARQDVIAPLGGELAGATRVELEGLADRFLAERTVAVVAERAVEERRWSTPELLAVEHRLVAAATDRIGEQTAVVSHGAVRARWPPIPPPAPTSRPRCVMSVRAVPASR